MEITMRPMTVDEAWRHIIITVLECNFARKA